MKRAFASAALVLAACMSTSTPPSDPPPSVAPGPGPQPPGPGPQQPGPDPIVTDPPATTDPTPTQPPLQGGGSDTETLTGMVATLDGLPAAGVPVKLLPSAYDPSRPDTSLIRRALTDGQGFYRFEKVDTARLWNVIAGDTSNRAWALARDLRPGSPASLILSPAKVLLVTLHVSGYATSDSGIAYFPGTDILARCDGRSVSKVDSVPAAARRLVIESRAGWKYDTTLAPGDTARVKADRYQILIAP